MGMDVTPISMQLLYPRSTEVTQIQHNMQHMAMAQQDFEMARQKADDKLKEKQVRAKDETEDGKIKDDQNRKGNGGAYGGGKRRQQEETDQGPDPMLYAIDPLRGHSLDITY